MGVKAERRRPGPSPAAMTLRRPFRPLRPELDGFLFAQVGGDIDGVPLSVVSALTRLGLDPWEEATRLSSLSGREAAEQLGRLIAELPGTLRPLREARELAADLVRLLPKHQTTHAEAPLGVRPRYRLPSWPKPSPFWIACLALATATLLSAILHGGFPFGIGGP